MIRAIWERRRFMRDHRWTQARLSAYLDGDLAGLDRERLEAHTGRCPECARVLAGLRRTLAALTRMRVDPRSDVTAGVLARLRSEP